MMSMVLCSKLVYNTIRVLIKRACMKDICYRHINGVPYKMHCFIEMQLIIICSVFLYSGSISSTVQATNIQKFSHIKVGCNFFVILQDTRFRFPNYLYRVDGHIARINQQRKQFEEKWENYKKLLNIDL